MRGVLRRHTIVVMAKHRLTLTVEAQDEGAIRDAAQAAGLDLSAFLRVAALSEAARIQRVREGFSEIDRLNRDAEGTSLTGDERVSGHDDQAAADALLAAADAEIARRMRGAAA